MAAEDVRREKFTRHKADVRSATQGKAAAEYGGPVGQNTATFQETPLKCSCSCGIHAWIEINMEEVFILTK